MMSGAPDSGLRSTETAPSPGRRVLVHVPVIHSAEDLGSFAQGARERLSAILGKEAVARRIAAIATWWRDLEKRVSSLPLEWEKTRLYQDGLPVCEHELAIVTELSHKGNPNHALLLSLVERGATLMGTEDASLVLQEYRRIQSLVQAERAGKKDAPALRAEGETILKARDAFIAARIDSTLREGEAGILFIGLSHKVAELLHDKMEVQPLVLNVPVEASSRLKGRG